MFEQVFESLRKTTEATVQTQQEFFRKWASLWPGVTAFTPPGGEPVQQFPRQWTEAIHGALQRQREYVETQFKAGLENIERAFALGEARSADELRAKTIELWQTCFASLRQAYEGQSRVYQALLNQCVELTTKCAA